MNTKRIILLMFNIGAIVLLFSHCEEREPVHFFIPEVVKEYGDFKEGSYWIYQIDSSDNEDSVWVASRTIGQNEEVVDKKVNNYINHLNIPKWRYGVF